MDLTIVEASRNRSEQVSVPASIATERIIGRLAEIWQLPAVSDDGRAVSYRFEDARTGHQIDPSATLADAGIGENDVLRLVAGAGEAMPPTVAQAPFRSAPDRSAFSPPSSAPALADWGAAGYQPRVSSPARRGISAPLALAVVGVILGMAAAVAFASGVISGGSKKSVPVGTQSVSIPQEAPAPQAPPTAAQQSSDREAIMSLLGSYQQAYSNHDLEGLEHLFTPNVRRHGLAKGGCRISRGISSVLASYQGQFEAGSGNYSLVGLSEQQIAIDTNTQAHLEAHYRITPGGSGYVNFKFTEEGSAWKISEVNAACH